MRRSVAIFILLRKCRLEAIGIDVKVSAVRDCGQYQGWNAIPLLLGLEGREAGRSRFSEQFLRQPLCLCFVALCVGICTGRDVFLDPCPDPPKKSLANDGPPISCVNIAPVTRPTEARPILWAKSIGAYCIARTAN